MLDNTFFTVIINQSPRYSKLGSDMDKFFQGTNIKKMTEKLKNIKVYKKDYKKITESELNYQKMKKM
jgi:hypothetical protein